MPKAPSPDLYEPREVFDSVNNAFIACSRAIEFSKVSQVHRKRLRRFAELLLAGLMGNARGPQPNAEIQPKELMLTLAILLKLAVVKAYPTELPAGAYRKETVE